MNNVTVGLYQHFKGSFYFVDNISIDCATDSTVVHYFNVLHPESGFFTRPVSEWYSPVIDRKDNVTGQSTRFKKVESLEYPIHNFSTSQLIEELSERTDSPLQKLDIEGLSNKCKYSDYCLGLYYPKNGGVDTIVSFETREQADKYIRGHHINKKDVHLYKRTFIEQDSICSV